ncbi:Single-stranded nucleic acid binding R3H [Penicillium angulare]|uniref:Single-stranded nucleic acid binding R3H n=1 Tax=Penicillium angulare TaxID=116970 RepID=UPI00253FB71E|nr:Single-stranded nucleic acid binding R3H [Penicillium angulare]KAJ5273559.1 Single-stranded nucleic acid binding R3H [Penicillium angulare]
MAIHPRLRPQASQASLSPQQTMAISAWTEQATASLQDLSLSESAPANMPVQPSTPTCSSLRGVTVPLSIPLDDEPPVAPSAQAKVTGEPRSTPTVSFRRRAPLRQDSLKSREALLKGKDGSRRRQRWENDRLLHNPWAEPPSSKDWDIEPTYTRHNPMPYYLAPLWDVHYSRVADHDAARKNAAKAANTKYRVPKELRSRLKHTRAARGMLQDLEDDVRLFIRKWNEKRQYLASEGLQDAPDFSASDDSEDEIVFVGRNGQMHDSPERRRTLEKLRQELSMHDERDGEKMVFESLVDDRAAAFGRWLVHSIASYYGLHTWSVTVGEPARREAYVGFHPPMPGSRVGLVTQPACHTELLNPGEELPRPLYAQV